MAKKDPVLQLILGAIEELKEDCILRERLIGIGRLRTEIAKGQAELRSLTTKAVREAQKGDEISVTEAIGLIGITRDTAYKALRKEAT